MYTLPLARAQSQRNCAPLNNPINAKFITERENRAKKNCIYLFGVFLCSVSERGEPDNELSVDVYVYFLMNSVLTEEANMDLVGK